MATLHIEHGVTDFATWKAAFDRFEGKRSEGGVTAHRIHQPYDDPAYIVLQLDFSTVGQAQAFRQMLETPVSGQSRRTLPAWQEALGRAFW